MTDLDDLLDLGPGEEARRLWAGARAALPRARSDLVALCEALDLGVRAAEILFVFRLQQVKEKFPATIALLLDLPEPEVVVERDSQTTPKGLGFVDAIDLVSEESLDCVSPALHRGWEDRRFSCRRSRATAREALSLAIGDAERHELLTLAAYRNRIFRCPPPVRVSPKHVLDAYPALERLIAALGAI